MQISAGGFQVQEVTQFLLVDLYVRHSHFVRHIRLGLKTTKHGDLQALAAQHCAYCIHTFLPQLEISSMGNSIIFHFKVSQLRHCHNTPWPKNQGEQMFSQLTIKIWKCHSSISPPQNIMQPSSRLKSPNLSSKKKKKKKAQQKLPACSFKELG